MSRKRKPAAHVNHERWLVSYADFITLLFAFFVVLFSSSQVDKRKVGKISAAMQEAFQQMGIFQAANSRTPMVTADPLPAENIQLIEDGKGMSGHGKMASPFEKMMGSPTAARLDYYEQHRDHEQGDEHGPDQAQRRERSPRGGLQVLHPGKDHRQYSGGCGHCGQKDRPKAALARLHCSVLKRVSLPHPLVSVVDENYCVSHHDPAIGRLVP